MKIWHHRIHKTQPYLILESISTTRTRIFVTDKHFFLALSPEYVIFRASNSDQLNLFFPIEEAMRSYIYIICMFIFSSCSVSALQAKVYRLTGKKPTQAAKNI